MTEQIKPSLAPENPADVAAMAEHATRLFGRKALLDPVAFEQACAQEREQALRERIKRELPELAADVDACSDMPALVEWAKANNVPFTLNILRQAAEGGKLPRIDDVTVHGEGNLTLSWGATGTGFGQMQLYIGADGNLHAETENMSRHFVRAVLLRLADELVIDD